MGLPRILAVMGSGEIAPAMSKVHRELFARLDAGRSETVRARGVLLDTPYRFQENAARLSDRIADHFRSSLGRELDVATFGREDAGDAIATTRVTTAILRAPYVFSGPGSPTYALEAWRDGPIPAAMLDRLDRGGVVTMASAAALTLGLLTVPVYEIYKVGEAPHWLDGLDVLGAATGLRAAIIPHFDNAEGGDHDTRFCYLGEGRLQALEARMPEDAFVLGVDGHTALVLDLDSGVASIAGLGGVTVRVAGASEHLPAGTATRIDDLRRRAERLRRQLAAGRAGAHPGPAGAAHELSPRVGSPAPGVDAARARVEAALDQADIGAATGSLLELDSALEARLRAGEDSPDLDVARLAFRALVVRLGEVVASIRADQPAIDPFVSTLLELRARARADRDWLEADFIRDRLTEAGVEVRDDAGGDTSWSVGSD